MCGCTKVKFIQIEPDTNSNLALCLYLCYDSAVCVAVCALWQQYKTVQCWKLEKIRITALISVLTVLFLYSSCGRLPQFNYKVNQMYI